MKIIKIEGCSNCPYQTRNTFHNGICKKLMKQLDIIWDVLPYYSHPECPLEEMKE